MADAFGSCAIIPVGFPSKCPRITVELSERGQERTRHRGESAVDSRLQWEGFPE